MIRLTLAQLHAAVGGRLRIATLEPPTGESTPLGRVVTDSRGVRPGDTFWGLAGTQRDGSVYAEEAFQRGAVGTVVARRYVQPAPGCWSLEVEDSHQALQRLAAWNRDRFAGTMIAVTGSVGKTTTRQMIDAVLRVHRQGSTSPRNYNNHVGLPISLLGMEPADDYAVVEIGASQGGEVGRLARLARPSIGVITRLGEAHLGGFGSLEALAAAKAELLAELPEDGWAVLAGDDRRLRRAALGCSANILWVGRSLDCDVVATRVESRAGLLTFYVEQQRFEVPIWGRHYLDNALVAIAVGKIFGMSLAHIAKGLAQFQSLPQRCEVRQVGRATIINDTYNASPTAMRAALELLRDFETTGQRIVVCGDMRELGQDSDAFHRRLGDEVVTLCGADLLVACGQHADQVAAGACEAGMAPWRVVSCPSPEEALSHLDLNVTPGDVVLVKGSRALAMERVVAALELRDVARAA